MKPDKSIINATGDGFAVLCSDTRWRQIMQPASDFWRKIVFPGRRETKGEWDSKQSTQEETGKHHFLLMVVSFYYQTNTFLFAMFFLLDTLYFPPQKIKSTKTFHLKHNSNFELSPCTETNQNWLNNTFRFCVKCVSWIFLPINSSDISEKKSYICVILINVSYSETY